jgi:hypothetical protein
MAHTSLHARPDPVFIVAVVFLLILCIAGAGLVGAIIGTLWMGAYPGGYLAWPGAIFGVLGFLVHFRAMMRKRSQMPSNPTPDADVRDVPPTGVNSS